MIGWNWIFTIATGVFTGMVALEIVRMGISMYLMARHDRKMREFYYSLPPELQNKLAADSARSSTANWAPDFNNLPTSGGSYYDTHKHGYL